jgi:2-haloacid dehalogenase
LRPKLLEAYLTLAAFPDAHAALSGLKARGARLGILSNGSPRMLAAAVGAAGIAGLLDAVMSVDMVHLYKPRAEVYALATDALSLKPADIVFVSSNRWDVMGAASFGLDACWVNRTRAPDEYADFAPWREISDLAALPNVDG